MADRAAGLLEVGIAAIGGGGDGIAETPRGRVFVPFAAPGDRLLVRPEKRRGKGRALRAEIVERLEDGPTRCAPVCRHFADCGGCALQHLDPDAYREWKTGRVREALSRQGLDPALVGELRTVELASRRRVGLKARSKGGKSGGVALGFYAAASHRIVDIAECPIMAAEIFDLTAPLRDLFGAMLTTGEQAEAAVTLAATGLDVMLRTVRPPDLALRERLARFADEHDLARLGWQELRPGRDAPPPEPVASRRPVQAVFSGIAVDLPPDAFLQPSAAGEQALAQAVSDALAGAERIADLYAGCGNFSFALAGAGATVQAFEAAADHVAALMAAAGRALPGGMVTAQRRDLVRRPLSADELGGFDAVALDPPRPGAAVQAAELARSGVAAIAYVSCNPVSFARDARVLVEGGYFLESVMALDQFLFTPHVELVAVLRRTG
ncbi:MAG: class I SAM-dependent RNA methyltransferase [Alphaproteobacteria bacterium]